MKIPRVVEHPLVIVGVAVAGWCLRRIDAIINPQFWAEDFLFLLDAEKLGWRSFLEPRAGYLHFLPRAIAYVGSWLDPFLQPGFFVMGSIAVTIAVMLCCLSSRHQLPLKPLLALAVVLVPHSGEVFFNPTNIQWIAALGLVLTVLKDDPIRPFDWLADVGFVLMAGLSGPFSIFALPLFAFRACDRRTWRSFALGGVCAVVALTQIWFVAGTPADIEFSGPFDGRNLAAVLSFRWVYSLFIGPISNTAFVPLSLGVGGLVLVFLGFAVAARSGQRRNVLLLLSFAAILLVLTTVRKRLDVWTFSDLDNGDRYWFIPKVVLLWTMIVFAGGHSVRWVRWGSAGLLACALIGIGRQFVCPPYRDYGWYGKCAQIRRGETVEVMINPDWKFQYQRTNR